MCYLWEELIDPLPFLLSMLSVSLLEKLYCITMIYVLSKSGFPFKTKFSYHKFSNSKEELVKDNNLLVRWSFE